MKCSNCKEISLHLRMIVGKDGSKNLCPACIVMDETEYENDNPYTLLRDTLRKKHAMKGIK